MRYLVGSEPIRIYAEAERRRVLPGEEEDKGGMDGFFTARLVRQG